MERPIKRLRNRPAKRQTHRQRHNPYVARPSTVNMPISMKPLKYNNKRCLY